MNTENRSFKIIIYSIILAAVSMLLYSSLYLKLIFESPLPNASVNVNKVFHDWHRVDPGSNLETSFIISNSGKANLILSEVTTSCGCTKPVLADFTVFPNKSTTLKVGFHVPSKIGPVAHFVKLKTNDPKKPELRIGLRAHSWLGLISEPESVRFQLSETEYDSDKSTKIVIISDPEKRPFKLLSMQSNMRNLKIICDDMDVNSFVHKIKLKLSRSIDIGENSGNLMAVTDRIKGSTITIPIILSIDSKLKISPFLINVNIETVKDQQLIAGNFILQYTEPHRKLSVKNFRFGSTWILNSHALTRIGEGIYSLKLVVLPKTLPGLYRESLEFTVDIDSQIFHIRINYYIQE
jgi:hypothetical protein